MKDEGWGMKGVLQTDKPTLVIVVLHYQLFKNEVTFITSSIYFPLCYISFRLKSFSCSVFYLIRCNVSHLPAHNLLQGGKVPIFQQSVRDVLIRYSWDLSGIPATLSTAGVIQLSYHIKEQIRFSQKQAENSSFFAFISHLGCFSSIIVMYTWKFNLSCRISVPSKNIRYDFEFLSEGFWRW